MNLSGKFFGGLMLIAIGVIFLLQQTGVISVDLGYIFSHFWPLILIAVGLNGLFVRRRYEQNWGFPQLWSLIIIALGLIFLNNNFGWIPNLDFGDLIRFAIPVILIAVGLNMLFRRKNETYQPKDWEPYSKSDFTSYAQQDNPSFDHDKGAAGDPFKGASGSQAYGSFGNSQANGWEGKGAKPKGGWHHCGHSDWNWSDPNVENRHNLIGDLHIGNDYWELRPMNISHFIGDTVLDLTRANIPYGETRINISAFIGDVKVFVPNDVQLEVSVRASSFLGDIQVFERREGGFLRHMKAESPQYYEAEKRVLINASMFIGDVRVKRVG